MYNVLTCKFKNAFHALYFIHYTDQTHALYIIQLQRLPKGLKLAKILLFTYVNPHSESGTSEKPS